MVTLVKGYGVWTTPKNSYTKVSGSWVSAKSIFNRVSGAWVPVYSRVVLSSSYSVNIRSLFDVTTWSNNSTKIVYIPSGVTINSDNWLGALYLDAGTAWGGELIVENHGSLLGKGGVSGLNSGEGGIGIGSEIAGLSGQRLVVNNWGTIYAGGGAGGQGGQGGSGFYDYLSWDETRYDPGSNGPDGNSCVTIYNDALRSWYWDGSLFAQNYENTVSYGGFDFALVSYYGARDGRYFYSVRKTRWSRDYTVGGVGGTGGRGCGSDGGAASGAGGGSPGTNAGWGGQGGSGGDWGAQGATGNAGGNGNNGGGSGGSAGSPGGRYAYGWLTFNNSGTVVGRIALN